MIARFVVFIGIAFGLLAAIHYYLWIRLGRDPRWPAPWSSVLGWFFVVAAVGMPLAAIATRGKAHSIGGQIAIWAAYTWVGGIFLFFFAGLAGGVGGLGI